MTAPHGRNAYPISLVDVDSGDTIIIQDPSGNALPLVVQSLQVSGADIREVVDDRPQADGTLDTTYFAGAAAVTCAVTCVPGLTAHQVEDTLRAWLRPRRRAWLTVQRAGWEAPRRMMVRADALSPPQSAPGPMVTMQMAWKAPNGVWESVDEFSSTIYPSGAASGGLSVPFSLPMSLGAGYPSGSALIVNDGTEDTPPLIRIYGPATGPGVTNATTGLGVQFLSTYALAAGDYVSIDVTGNTVLLNDDPSQSRFSFIDWSQTDLWALEPGENQISFTGTGLSAITQAVLTWHERYA
jgi:hypothetical protein